MAEPLLAVEELRVAIAGGGPDIVRDIGFTVGAGEIVGLVGESGSGKTTIATALLGHARAGARIVSGRVAVAGCDLLTLAPAALAQVRGADVAYVPQDPATALDPMQRIGDHLGEMLSVHAGRLDPTERRERIAAAARAVELPAAPDFLRRFPHQLSGGQQQRVLLALAFILQPRVIVLDEPTTALDVTTQAHILATVHAPALADRPAGCGFAPRCPAANIHCRAAAPALVSAAHGGKVACLHPEDDALRRDPVAVRVTAADGTAPLIELRGLTAGYGEHLVLHEVGLDLPAGRCTALVGASGSGKTTLARAIAGIGAGIAGQMAFAGEIHDLARRDRPRALRQRIQYVFQNPYRALNPRHAIREILTTTLRHFHVLGKGEAEQAMLRLLDRVALPAAVADRRPRDLSGGERQRVAIARALAAEPELLICDEVTSALDVSVQAAILDMLDGLRKNGLTLLFVTHDLGVVRAIADHVAVLAAGEIVEVGAVADVLDHPRHEHSRGLLRDAPRLRRVGDDARTAADVPPYALTA